MNVLHNLDKIAQNQRYENNPYVNSSGPLPDEHLASLMAILVSNTLWTSILRSKIIAL